MTHTSYEEFIRLKNRQFGKDRDKKKPISMKDRGRAGSFFFVREAWTFMAQHNFDEKVFVVERPRKEGREGSLAREFRDGEIEYRIGYFIIGKNGKLRDRWAWGQFCPLIPAQDLRKLVEKAEREGTILPASSPATQS